MADSSKFIRYAIILKNSRISPEIINEHVAHIRASMKKASLKYADPFWIIRAEWLSFRQHRLRMPKNC
jgi:hypothetical protein